MITLRVEPDVRDAALVPAKESTADPAPLRRDATPAFSSRLVARMTQIRRDRA
jgi:hypothetical protein